MLWPFNVIWISSSRIRNRGGPGARPIVNIEIAVSTSMKLVDSDGNLNWDIDAPDDHARQLATGV